MRDFKVELPDRGVEIEHLSTDDTFKTLLTKREGIVLASGDHKVILSPLREGGKYEVKNLHKKIRVERITKVDSGLWQAALKAKEGTL